MQLVFKGGAEVIKFIIDRKNKKLKLASSKTNYELKEVPFKLLFDRGKERIQEKLTDKLNDTDFIKVIVMAMANQGYMLQKEGFKK